MRQRVVVVLGALILTGAALVGRIWIEAEPRYDLVISTGTDGGTYITVGDQLARVLETYPQASIGSARAIPSAGSIQNINRLLSNEADVALVVGPTLIDKPSQIEKQLRYRIFY